MRFIWFNVFLLHTLSKYWNETHHYSYLWFLSKQPQFVLGSAHLVFGVRSGSWWTISFPVSFGCVADSPIRTRSAQMLTEVLKGKVAWRFKARLKRLHDDGWILTRAEDRQKIMSDRGMEVGGWKLRSRVYVPFAHRQLSRQKPSLLDIWKWWEWLYAPPQQNSWTSPQASLSAARPFPAGSATQTEKWKWCIPPHSNFGTDHTWTHWSQTIRGAHECRLNQHIFLKCW